MQSDRGTADLSTMGYYRNRSPSIWTPGIQEPHSRTSYSLRHLGLHNAMCISDILPLAMMFSFWRLIFEGASPSPHP